ASSAILSRNDVPPGPHRPACRSLSGPSSGFHTRSIVPFVSADPYSRLSQRAHAACGVPPGLRLATAPGWPPGGHGVTLLMHPERERHRMITGPGDEMAAAGPGDIRASHADRERVIDTVKAAFARGELTA